MPRLGGEEPARPQAAEAYPQRRKPNLYAMLAIFMIMVILRNVFVKDYRAEEIAQLRAAGTSEAEIQALYPPSRQEQLRKIQTAKSEYEILKSDVALLKLQVKKLQEAAGIQDTQILEKTTNTDLSIEAIPSSEDKFDNRHEVLEKDKT